MAKESKIAEQPLSVLSSEISYTQKTFTHPSYRFMPQFPNTFGQAINLSSSSIPSTINIPPEVFNLSNSYLTFKMTLPAVAGNYIWTHEDIPASGSLLHLQHYISTNKYIVDIDNANNYLKACKKDIPVRALQTGEPLNGEYPSNVLNNVVPALRQTASIGVAAGVNPEPAPSQSSFVEQAYFNCGAFGTDVVKQFVIPLNKFKDTFLAVDKDVYYGVLSYLKIYFAPLNKICYQSTNNINPSAGTPTAYTGANARIEALTLMLAVEDNVNINESVRNKFIGGMSMMIPYTQAFKVSNQGNVQSVSQMFDVGSGASLMRIKYQVYNTNEANDLAYDCANNATLVNGATNDANLKIKQFYTQLNGKRNQDLTIDCTFAGGVFTDYMSMKRYIKGSILQNLNQYQYNWVWIEDFCEFGAKELQDGVQDDLIAGIPMGATPLTYTFYGANMTSANYTHYFWATFSKTLNIRAGQSVEVSP